MVTIDARNYYCVCGKRGEYLNLRFGAEWGNALCEKCRDKALAEYNAKTR